VFQLVDTLGTLNFLGGFIYMKSSNSITHTVQDAFRNTTFSNLVKKDISKSIIPSVMNPEFIDCPKCKRRAFKHTWEKNYFACPNCGQYKPIGGYYRLSLILDKGTFNEMDYDLLPITRLIFQDMKKNLRIRKKRVV